MVASSSRQEAEVGRTGFLLEAKSVGTLKWFQLMLETAQVMADKTPFR